MDSSPVSPSSINSEEEGSFEDYSIPNSPMEVQYQEEISELKRKLEAAQRQIQKLQSKVGKQGDNTKSNRSSSKVCSMRHFLSFFTHEQVDIAVTKPLLDRRRAPIVPRSTQHVRCISLPTCRHLYCYTDGYQHSYGSKDVKAIANHVGTRNATQVRTHAQKYFLRLVRVSTSFSFFR